MKNLMQNSISKIEKKTILITGGSGRIGEILVDYLLSEGHLVVLAGRNEKIKFNLGDDINFENVDFEVLIHLAYDKNISDPKESRIVNYLGTLRLYEEAKQNNIGHFIHISSDSAKTSPRSLYGSNKLECEKSLVGERNVSILRLGIVAGRLPIGPYKSLVWIATKFRILLDPFQGKKIFISTSIEEICKSIKFLIHSGPTQRVTYSSKDLDRKSVQDIFFEDFPKKNVWVIHLPVVILVLFSRFINFLGINFELKGDSFSIDT